MVWVHKLSRTINHPCHRGLPSNTAKLTSLHHTFTRSVPHEPSVRTTVVAAFNGYILKLETILRATLRPSSSFCNPTAHKTVVSSKLLLVTMASPAFHRTIVLLGVHIAPAVYSVEFALPISILHPFCCFTVALPLLSFSPFVINAVLEPASLKS